MPNVTNANVIGAFLSKTTCESLAHKLGCKNPRTIRELHDIATSHASGEEVVGAIFDRNKDKAKWEESTASEGGTSHFHGKKNKKEIGGSLVAAAERKGERASYADPPDFFEKKLEGPWPNHAYPIKHAYIDYFSLDRTTSPIRMDACERRGDGRWVGLLPLAHPTHGASGSMTSGWRKRAKVSHWQGRTPTTHPRLDLGLTPSDE